MSTSIFSPAQLDAIVATTLANNMIGSIHQNAIIGTVDQSGAQVVASFNRDFANGADWTLQAAARHEWTGDNELGAKVILAW